MNSVQWIVKFSNVSQNVKLTSKMMNSKMMNSVWWIIIFENFGKWPEFTSCDTILLLVICLRLSLLTENKRWRVCGSRISSNKNQRLWCLCLIQKGVYVFGLYHHRDDFFLLRKAWWLRSNFIRVIVLSIIRKGLCG